MVEEGSAGPDSAAISETVERDRVLVWPLLRLWRVSLRFLLLVMLLVEKEMELPAATLQVRMLVLEPMEGMGMVGKERVSREEKVSREERVSLAERVSREERVNREEKVSLEERVRWEERVSQEEKAQLGAKAMVMVAMEAVVTQVMPMIRQMIKMS
jgi:hypothetical protein